MKKKLIIGILLLAFLLCAPFSCIDLSSGVSTKPAEAAKSVPLPPPAPAPVEAPAFNEGTYTLSLTSSVGLLTYYNQNDTRWASSLYGGQDPISAYGCGPTVLAMIVSSFTEQCYLPSDMAGWAAANNFWAAGSGTKHNFFLEGAAAFGFHAVPFQKFTPEDVISELRSGHILVALMGPGHFSDSGHFIIIYNYWAGSQVSVADPASLERTQTPWEAQLILDELLYGASGGGPMWSISPK